MNAMSHEIPNVIGVDQSKLQEKLEQIAPGAMAMGTTGMAEHAAHQDHMGSLPNTLPMMVGTGPFGPIEMGGMFTVMKMRERLASYEVDPGWYEYPPGIDGYPHPKLTAKDRRDFQMERYQQCQKCHPDQYKASLDSNHARALASGNREGAICTDCHGAHDVKKPDEPRQNISDYLPEVPQRDLREVCQERPRRGVDGHQQPGCAGLYGLPRLAQPG